MKQNLRPRNVNFNVKLLEKLEPIWRESEEALDFGYWIKTLVFKQLEIKQYGKRKTRRTS